MEVMRGKLCRVRKCEIHTLILSANVMPRFKMLPVLLKILVHFEFRLLCYFIYRFLSIPFANIAVIMHVPVMSIQLVLVIKPLSLAKLTFRMVLFQMLILFKEFVDLLLKRQDWLVFNTNFTMVDVMHLVKMRI